MRRRVLKCVLILSMFTGCSSPSHNSPNGSPQTDEHVATGLRAVAGDAVITLSFEPVPDALAYDVFREEEALQDSPSQSFLFSAPGTSVPGKRLLTTRETSYKDTDVRYGNRYSYRVVALGPWGESVTSAAASVDYRQFNGWLQAPLEAVDWSQAIGFAGGNYGDPSTTGIARFNNWSCPAQVDGIHIVEKRPSNFYLPMIAQTFSIKFQYRTRAAGTRYTLRAMSNFLEPIYQKTGTLSSACGEKTETFSVDLRQLASDDISISVFLGNEYAGVLDTNSYSIARHGTVNVASPVVGATVLGSPLRIELDHVALDGSPLILTLDGLEWKAGVFSGFFPLGSTTVVASGTGTTVVELPFQELCGFSSAQLTLRRIEPALTGEIGGVRYNLALPAGNKLGVAATDLWLPRNNLWPGNVDLHINDCAGNNSAVTVSATWPLSIQHTTASGISVAQEVTGSTADTYRLTSSSANLTPNGFGHIGSFVTASFPETVSTVVNLNIFELFWKTQLPATLTNQKTYPLAITFMGPKPVDQLALHWDAPLLASDASWNSSAQAFTWQVTPMNCGANHLTVGFQDWRASGAYQINSQFTVTGGAPSAFLAQPLGGRQDIAFEGDDAGPRDIDIVLPCGALHWHVLSAPSWLRFEMLDGPDTTPIRVGLLAKAAYASAPHPAGMILIGADETSYLSVVWVCATRSGTCSAISNNDPL